MLNEFKAFIARGNVMDLAVGVIIGGAFGGIVKSLVDDLIMPIVGAIFGGFDFSNYFLPLSSAVNAQSLAAAREQGAVFAYGSFLTVLINFLILAWIIFLMVKGVNTLRAQVERQEKVAPEELPAPLGRRSAADGNPRSSRHAPDGLIRAGARPLRPGSIITKIDMLSLDVMGFALAQIRYEGGNRRYACRS